MDRLITRNNFYVNHSLTPIVYGNNQQKTDTIISAISEISGLSIETLKSPSRKREAVEWRHIICYICYANAYGSLAFIGLNMGGRDHSTVINGRNTVQSLLDTNDKDFAQKWAVCKQLVR